MIYFRTEGGGIYYFQPEPKSVKIRKLGEPKEYYGEWGIKDVNRHLSTGVWTELSGAELLAAVLMT